jgi:hypothetical protein
VAQQKPAFVEFLKSLSFTSSGAAGLPPSHPPIGDAAMPLMSAGASSSSPGEGKPDWQVPSGWQEVAAGQFLIAKFTVQDPAHGQAAINVSMSAGDGGGLALNVNRWRDQLGLSPLSEPDLKQAITSVDTSGGNASLVELSGKDARTGQNARLVGAVVPQGTRTWFYKLMGNEQVVGAQKDAFIKFMQTAKYPNGP